MQKETILAKIRVHMKFSREAVSWFEELGNSNIWFAQDYGMPFLSELRGTWNEVLISSSEPIIQDYFVNQGLLKDKLPRVKVFESYPGSWIIDAAIVMLASVGTAYTILKGISELPKIADGLNELKERLKKGFSQLSSKSARDHLEYHVKQHHLPKPPAKLIENDFTIDVRPLLSLTPSLMKSHRVHLNAAISRDAFTLENLGEELMRDIRIGIFKSTSQRNQWCYVDSYMGSVDILSPKQTITKDITEFKGSNGQVLDLSDDCPLHIDCWVQDTHGIYLFLFFLEKE